MGRTKSTEYVGFKCPPELREDMLFLAARRGWTESEIWKHAGERLCTFIRTIHLDYYDDIRPFHSFLEDQPDSTLTAKVEPG
jgi:hypothetical protein